MKFDHTTIDQLGAAVRKRYKTAAGAEAANLANWLYGRSDAELQAWFGVPNANALRARLKKHKDATDAVKQARGE